MPFWLFAVDTHKILTQGKDFMWNPRLLPAIPTPSYCPLAGFTWIGAKQNVTTKPAILGEMLSSLLENSTPPIVDSFSSHGRQFKFREWCETEPTLFRSYPRRQECPTIYNRFEPKAEKIFSVISRPWGVGSKASTEPGASPLMGGSEYFTSRFVNKRSFVLQISNTSFLVLLDDHPSSPYSSFHGTDCRRKLQTTAHNPPHVEIVVSSHQRSSSYQHSWARSPDCWGRGGW